MIMNKKHLTLSLASAVIILAPQRVLAHCPLCTAGAGAIAAAALALGVRIEAVGILVGAFAAALGFYLANRIKRRYVKGQKWLVVIGTFLLTIVPLVPFMYVEPYPLVIYWFGEMGSAFNRVYLVDRFVFSSIIGGMLMTISPLISAGLTKLREGKRLPYQSLLVTFILLFVVSFIVQFAI